MVVFGEGEGAEEERAGSVEDGEATVEFSAGGVVRHILGKRKVGVSLDCGERVCERSLRRKEALDIGCED